MIKYTVNFFTERNIMLEKKDCCNPHNHEVIDHTSNFDCPFIVDSKQFVDTGKVEVNFEKWLPKDVTINAVTVKTGFKDLCLSNPTVNEAKTGISFNLVGGTAGKEYIVFITLITSENKCVTHKIKLFAESPEAVHMNCFKKKV